MKANGCDSFWAIQGHCACAQEKPVAVDEVDEAGYAKPLVKVIWIFTSD
jgi:hypothetical protein